MKFPKALFLVFMLLLSVARATDGGVSQQVHGTPASIGSGTAQVILHMPQRPVRPGSTFEGVVEFRMAPGWHLYWKNPGDIGLAPSFDWQLPEGISVTRLLWPTPALVRSGSVVSYGYEGTAAWIVQLAVDAAATKGSYPITLSAFWLACDGSCVPESRVLSTSITISPEAEEGEPLPAVAEARRRIPKPVVGGQVTLDTRQATLSIPLTDGETKNLDHVTLFPEWEGFFSIDRTPSWKRFDDRLEITIPRPTQPAQRSAPQDRLTGVLQLTFSGQKPAEVYAVDLPVLERPADRTRPGPTPTTVPAAKVTPVDPNALGLILLLAFLGGIALNVTPCVLPVIGLKILHFLSLKGAKGKGTFKHGLLFTLGVLLSFWALAGVLYLLEYTGSVTGWGFQWQHPLFVLALIIVLFCFAMNLFGIFEIGTSIASWAAEIEEGIRHSSPSCLASFLSGLLATAVATPCTGPLLGSVLGFASAFNPREGLLIFSAMGLGMALPFLIITACPPLIRWLPKPGLWMIGLKQFFGFSVLATVVWLFWVLSALSPTLALVPTLLGLFLIGFGLWVGGRFGSPIRSRFSRFVSKSLACVLILSGIASLASTTDPRIASFLQSLYPTRDAINWQPYSEERVRREVDNGETVFLEFTAKWCLNCQVNTLVFASPRVRDAFTAYHVVPFTADWTDGNPAITAQLRSLGRNGVPVYVILRKGREPVILPELITPDIVVNAIREQS